MHWIVNVLTECGELTKSSEKLCGGLGLRLSEIEEIKAKLWKDRDSSTYSFLTLALDKWITVNGEDSTITEFIRILKAEGYVSAAEAVLESSRRRGSKPGPTRAELNESSKELRNRIWFDVPDKITIFTGRREELEQVHQSILKQNEYARCIDTDNNANQIQPMPSNNDSKNRIKKISALCGMGGIGKTTLSIHYAWQMKKFYHSVIWINSDTIAKLQESFRRLISQKLRIAIPNAEGTSLSYELLQTIYEYFSGTKTLFVFDNVEKSSFIRKYLPSTSSPDVEKPYILITSRNQTWGDKTDLIQLNVFSDEESNQFFKDYLLLKTKPEEEYAKKISKLLQNLPLAIRQAGAYISKQCGNGNCSQDRGFQMKLYIENLKASSKVVLDFPFWDKTEDKYERTTFTTWNVTVETIKRQSKVAVQIMELVAYLSPDDIPIQLFTYLKRHKIWQRLKKSVFVAKNEIDEAIQLLSDYSMIVWTTGRSTFNVHRLVQQVIRIQVEERRKYHRLGEIIKAMKQPLKMINNYDEFERQCLVQCAMLKEYIKSNSIEDSFLSFLKLLEEKQEDLLEDHISKFGYDFRNEDYAKAFELLNAFIRKKHRLDKFGLQLENMSPYYVLRFSKVVCTEIDLFCEDKPVNSYVSCELSQEFGKLLRSVIRLGLSDKEIHRGTLEALRDVPKCALKVVIRTEDPTIKSALFRQLFIVYNLFYNYYEEHKMYNRITEIAHGIIHCLAELNDTVEIMRFIDKFKQILQKLEVMSQKYPYSEWMNLTDTIFSYAKHKNCVDIRSQLLQEAYRINSNIHKVSKQNIPAFTVALVLKS